MTKPTPKQRAKEITEDFTDKEFEDEQTAMRWLTERIAAAIEEAEKRGREAYYAGTDNRRSGGPGSPRQNYRQAWALRGRPRRLSSKPDSKFQRLSGA
jgi:hypothetical protein